MGHFYGVLINVIRRYCTIGVFFVFYIHSSTHPWESLITLIQCLVAEHENVQLLLVNVQPLGGAVTHVAHGVEWISSEFIIYRRIDALIQSWIFSHWTLLRPFAPFHHWVLFSILCHVIL